MRPIKDVTIEGKGDKHYVNLDDTAVNIEMEILHNCESCGGAINQIIVGLSSSEIAQKCVWIGGKSSYGWETVQFSLNVPQKKGVYYIRSRYAQAYNCNNALKWWKVDRINGPTKTSNIGTIVVR